MCSPALPPFHLPWWAPGHSSMSTPYLLHFYLLTCLTLPELDTESQMCLVNLGANKQMTGSNCSIILTELNYISTGVLCFFGALQKLNLSTVVEDLPLLRKQFSEKNDHLHKSPWQMVLCQADHNLLMDQKGTEGKPRFQLHLDGVWPSSCSVESKVF